MKVLTGQKTSSFLLRQGRLLLRTCKDLTLETTPKGDILENGSSNPKGIKATIPNSTARIHFVANATLDITHSPKWIGMHENMLMTSFESSAGEDQSQKSSIGDMSRKYAGGDESFPQWWSRQACDTSHQRQSQGEG